MIKKIKEKLRKRRNTKENIIETQKEEICKLQAKINEKNEMIFNLFDVRDELKLKIKELLEENSELRGKVIKIKR